MILTEPALNYKPKRIVSLVPSQTELLFDLGLEAETVGITKFCVHPHEWFRNKTRVGGTKTVHIDKIKELQPDLIIANKEENVKEQIEVLSDIAPVWVSDIQNLDDAIQMIQDIGQLTRKTNEANDIVSKINSAFASLKQYQTSYHKALYFIWYNPWMTVGHDTFIHDMLQKAGLENVSKNLSRYPSLSEDDIRNCGADLVLLSSEPFPFKEKHIDLIKQLLPSATIKLADGEMFSWYGSRLLKAPEYFMEILS